MPRLLAALLPLLCLLLGSGCGSFSEGQLEKVTVLSVPAGADVAVGNVAYGPSPTQVELGNKYSHEARLSLPGYEIFVHDILPQLTDDGRSDIQFGFAKQTGAYNRLGPNPLIAIMSPINGYPPDPYTAMNELLAQVEQLHRAGKLSREEANTASEQVVLFFNRTRPNSQQ